MHPYANARLKDQKDTIKGLSEIRKRYYVVDRLCETPTDYDLLLKAFWDEDDIIVIEQDNGCSLKLLEELISCRGLWCLHWYYQYYKDMHGYKIRAEYYDEKGKKSVDKTQGYKIVSGLGFTKISKEIQESINSEIWYLKGTWMNLDARIAVSIRSILGINPHVHKMCAHHHEVGWASDRHNVPVDGINNLFQVGMECKVVKVVSDKPLEKLPDVLTVHQHPSSNITVNWVDGKGKPIDVDKPIAVRRVK